MSVGYDDFVDARLCMEVRECDRCGRTIRKGEGGVWFGEWAFNCRECSLDCIRELKDGIERAEALLERTPGKD